MLNPQQQEKIALEVIKTLKSRFDTFPEDAEHNRNAPFHEAFLQAFADKLEHSVANIPIFISLASWQHGLNTTLGQSFFENVAHIISNGEKREYTSKKLGNLQLSQQQKDSITRIITDLSNGKQQPNLSQENQQILRFDETAKIDADDFSADVFYQDHDSVVAIELKTVKPNSGGIKGEKQKILEGKAALFHAFPNKKIHFFFGFPFDPTVNPKNESVVAHDKTRFLNSIVNAHKFCDPAEVLLAGELWDFLSGSNNTMQAILDIINRIATTDFLDKFHLLQDNSQRDNPAYAAQLQKWFLYSEHQLIVQNSQLQNRLNEQASLQRIYHKTIFNSEGKYQWDRYTQLHDLLNSSVRKK
ncbi:TdeIII family type II restriction endonuclease [Stenoxybacter acetivorans]|uniref:TdeIII family type II restriction endonuclease n=1 Tax=Stenoxybacter acetivorans TaxID=422441 RepID=UPI000569311E|nr:TdeIII family type II restriction endonuclease [Stenoxybacter acetivorans]